MDLDSMNPKQQLKEYKAAQKEIKSKDIPVKTLALKKFEDIRYLTEGGCLVPFINSILPKKKTLDVSQLCLENLLLFIQKRKNDNIDETPIVLALNNVFSTEGNLSILKVLSDSLIFYEEIKKPKKKKAKKCEVIEDDPPVKEDHMYEIIRKRSLKSLYYIVKDLYANTSEMVHKLQIAFSNIENIINSLCQLLMNLKSKLTSEDSQERLNSIQDGIYAFMILTFAIRFNSDTIVWFVKSELVIELFEFAKIEQFTLLCIQILEILSNHNHGIKYLQSSNGIQPFLLNLLDQATSNLLKANELLNSSVPSTGKDNKKDDKNKKGAVVEDTAIDPYAGLDYIKVEPARCALASIKLISKLYTVLGSQQINTSIVINIDIVPELVSLVSKSMLNPLVYKEMRAELQSPLDEPLDDVLDTMCILCGTLGLISTDIRCSTYNSGALVALFKVLIDSKGIIAGNFAPVVAAAPVTTGGKGAILPVENTIVLEGDDLIKQNQRINKLRRVIEKAILNLLTENLENPLDDALAGHVSHGLELSVRWTSCFTRKTDDQPFNVPELNLANNLLALISTYEKDIDLANRGIRVLAAILHGHSHPVELIESKELQKLLTTQISLLIDHRALELILIQVSNDLKVLNNVIVDTDKSEAVFLESKSEELGPVTDDVLVPMISESLYLALSIMELFLMTTPEVINSFATIPRIEILVDLLKSSGPINSPNIKTLGTTITTNNLIFSNLMEITVTLNDPRKHSWIAASTSSSIIYADNSLIRPLLFDVLSIIAASGMKYRIYDKSGSSNTSLPAPARPCEPIPTSTSLCEEASLTICKVCADVCCAVLLSQASYQWTVTGSIHIQPNKLFKLVPAVQDSALSLLKCISSCGVRGIAGSLSAIASAGISFITSPHQMDLSDPGIDLKLATKEILDSRCAMKDLCGMLININSTTEICDLVGKDYNWKRPQFFDEIFPVLDDILTSKELVLRNPQLWPIITYCSAFICTLANPETDSNSASLTLDGLKAATKLPILEDSSQPVLNDAIAAVFLCIGGGVALSGLVGRFGNLPSHKKHDACEFISYLFNRGQCREFFWREWELSHKEVEAFDPKTGKSIVKKDDKKGKDKPADKGKGEIKPVYVVPEVELNLESTNTFPDPNHGPNSSFWLRLLEIAVDDLHEKCMEATALTSLTQGSSSELAILLINLGVDVNHCDGTLHSSLMYGLLLNDNVVVPALLAKSNLDMLDNDRNPTLKYVMLSMSVSDIDNYFQHSYNGSSTDSMLEIYGRPLLLSLFLDTKIDFNVCDTEGLSAIMIALGQGSLSIKIGGYSVVIRNESYNNPNYGFSEIHQYLVELIQVGTQVNQCNCEGQVPLHISAAKGDLLCIQTLLDHEAIPNALDAMGYLPFHYLVACCPENASDCFDLLLRYSSHRHIEPMIFEDHRTGVPEEQKNEYEINKSIKQVFDESFNPSVISKKRLVPKDLLRFKIGKNMNILQLCLASRVLLLDNTKLKPFMIIDNKPNRMKLALHLLEIGKSIDMSDVCGLLSNIDDQGLTCIHAASLLLQGITPQMYLTSREINAKRVRKFVSDEAQLLDYLLSYNVEQVYTDINSKCYHPISVLSTFGAWNPIQIAIINDNPVLVQRLLHHGYQLEQSEIVHFLAQYCPLASIELCNVIVHDVTKSSYAHALLNEKGEYYSLPCRPLHKAVRYGNVHLIQTLTNCVKVDLNTIDEDSGHTALYEAACISSTNNLNNELVQAFLPGSHRIDFFVSGYENTFRTPLNIALETFNVDMLKILIEMRKNDIILQLLQNSNKLSNQNDDSVPLEIKGTTLLYMLEEENIQFAKQAGINIPINNNNNNVTNHNLFDSTINVVMNNNDIDIIENPIKNEKDYNNDNTNNNDDMNDNNIDDIEHDLSNLKLNITNDTIITNIIDSPNNNNNNNNVIEVEEEEPIVQTGFGSKYIEEKRNIYNKYLTSNEILRIVINLVNSSGIVTEEHHVNEYYYHGNLIDE